MLGTQCRFGPVVNLAGAALGGRHSLRGGRRRGELCCGDNGGKHGGKQGGTEHSGVYFR